jgi:surfactin synthase thioesterase subunit
MRPWARETCSKFHLRLIGGGNTFFIGPALAGFTREIVHEIERCHDRGDAS